MKKIDCLSSTDELQICSANPLNIIEERTFYCVRQMSSYCIRQHEICNGHEDCDNGDDEQFCQVNATDIFGHICWPHYRDNLSDVGNFFCMRPYLRQRTSSLHLASLFLYDIDHTRHVQSFNSLISPKVFDRTYTSSHHGLDLRVWLNDAPKSTTKTTLCPPMIFIVPSKYYKKSIFQSSYLASNEDSKYFTITSVRMEQISVHGRNILMKCRQD